jgi:hypothetical protein
MAASIKADHHSSFSVLKTSKLPRPSALPTNSGKETSISGKGARKRSFNPTWLVDDEDSLMFMPLREMATLASGSPENEAMGMSKSMLNVYGSSEGPRTAGTMKVNDWGWFWGGGVVELEVH